MCSGWGILRRTWPIIEAVNQRSEPGLVARMIQELIGWTAAALLIATIGRQVYTQWREGTTAGVSKWLFIGQVSASVGFVIYSWLLRDWVFVATNAVMLATAILGQWVYVRNSRKDRRGGARQKAKKPYSARG
jgi:MtN3 and saliva related transmembrane protein